MYIISHFGNALIEWNVKCTYMQQHANAAKMKSVTRTATMVAPPNVDVSMTSTSSGSCSSLQVVRDTSDDEARVKCFEWVQNNSVDDADGGVGSKSPILPFLEISSGDMAIVKVIIVRQEVEL